MKRFVLSSVLLASSALFAQSSTNTGTHTHTADKNPCHEIKELCEKTGFKEGQWKAGTGLWRDCINPIMQGAMTVPGATKALPNVDATIVAACKAKNPKFGQGEVGSTPKGKK